MADNFYTSCAEVLALCQSMQDNLEAILDPETGFAPRLRDLCRTRIEEWEQGENGGSEEELESLRLEQHTWALLQAVMPARKMDIEPMPNARDLLAQNPYTPTSTIAQAVMNASPLLTELVVVREWLQDTAPPPQHPEATTGYWKFTKHGIMQSLRTAGMGERESLVKEMDPDAINRGDGKFLASDDTAQEKNLMQALYAYVRAGKLDDALALCRRAHQPWRSASIRGSFLFRWKAIANEENEEDAMDEDESWGGNFRRNQWKSACIRAALSPHLPDAERVLYAALAPSPRTYSILKSACRTWEDHLWAQVSIMCEEKQQAELTKLGGSFWAGGFDAVAEGVTPITREAEEAEEEEWENEAIGTLESLGEVHVDDGLPADHPFHYSQLQIILNRSSSLLETFATGLRDGRYTAASPDYATMCRFFAHLFLYLQMIDISVPPLAAQIVLEAYLQVLEDAGQRDLIAMYASALGDNAVERYAMFLTSLELSSDVAERRMALVRARDHGLDVDRVAIVTAERTIEKAFELLPEPEGPLPSATQLRQEPTPEEAFLLRSIEWTTFFPPTYPTALEQANVIIRYFLACGRVDLAESILPILPRELSAFDQPEHLAAEYLHYHLFFNNWALFKKVDDYKAKDTAAMSRDLRAAWVQEYTGLVEQVKTKTIKLLTSDWLVTNLDAGGARRREQLVRIRQIFIPELIIRLHFVLFHSSSTIPGNLKQTLELVNIVADSRYRLYEDFADGSGLGDYLRAVKSAVLGGVQGGGSDVFRSVV